MRGLYVITSDRFASPEALLNEVERALKGGACIVQYRDKNTSTDGQQKIARKLLLLCRQYNALLIINDNAELALAVEANGVHLGRDDGSIKQARQLIGKDMLIGVSCYDSLQLAIQAVQDGADYVAFGRFYPSLNKPEAVQTSPEILKHARQQLTVPIVAIGGITAQNGAPLIEAGADMLAVIDGVFGQADITKAAREITSLF
jgi:thiamine-phosphate pyrophosphorylase